MSSEANREYVKDTVSYYVGDDVVVKSSAGEDNLVRGVSEYDMRVDVKEQLNLDVPVFQYKPEEMQFVEYEIYNQDGMALVYYLIEDKKIVLYISDDNNKKSNMKTYDGKLIDTIFNDYNIIPIDIFENSNEDGTQSYYAKWKKNDCSYIFIGMPQKREFYKILKKMTF